MTSDVTSSARIPVGYDMRRKLSSDSILVVAALVAGLAALLFNWFGTGYAATKLLEDEATAKAVRWGKFLQSDLAGLDDILLDGTLSFSDQHALSNAVTAGDILRYKFYDKNGVIVLASLASDVGKRTTESHFTDYVSKGKTFTKIANSDEFEDGRSYISEAYIPMMESGEFRGAIEVYSDVSERAEEMQDLRIFAFVVFFTFTLLLGAVLAVVVTRQRNAQQLAEDRLEAETTLRAVNDELEERVSQRTQDLKQEIHSHLETEVDLVAAMEAAERANAAKSEFLSSVSHELRTPMNAIMGFAQMLQHSAADKLSERDRENIAQIIENGDRMVTLVDQILDLSKIESTKFAIAIAEVPINDVIRECLEKTKRDATAKRLSVSVTESSCANRAVTVDRNCLKQVLFNLVSNAIKYNRDGGEVTIACDQGEPDHLKISVTDTGCGIPATQHEGVFQPFQRLGHEATTIEGAGIGLSISKALVEIMGGQIGFSSEPDVGSTFWIELPVGGGAPTGNRA